MEHIFLDTLVAALPLVPVFMGIYMVFRIRADFDLTIDGSFALGGAVVAVALMHAVPVPVAMILAVMAAGATGLVTALLHLTLRIPVLLAGLVMSLGLFSVNLHVLGSPTLSLGTGSTLFSSAADLSFNKASLAISGLLAVILLVVLGAFALFLKTEIGLALRTTGVNERMARSQGVNDKALMALSLVIANGLAGLAGCLVVQNQGFVDVNMGTGTFVAGVGAVLLGELLLRPSGSKVLRIVLAVVAGAIVYELILVVALREGLAASDLSGATALTLIVAVAAQRYLRPLLSSWTRRRRETTRDPVREPTDAHQLKEMV
jgi:putative ABC transport system permease protein